MNLTPPQQQTLDSLVSDLSAIPGVAAIVIGGSHCMGLAGPGSDIDLGLYYDPGSPFEVAAVRGVAARYQAEGTATVTDFYGWGPWVNGGAWLQTATGEVDLVYRNLRQVRETIDKAARGIWENDYSQQPPYGFSNVIYLAETHFCIVRHDPGGVMAALKAAVAVYPPALKASIVQQALWSAEFTLWQADAFARKQDVYNATGCFTRAQKALVDALYALNEWYPMGDKHALRQLQTAPTGPEQVVTQLEAVWTQPALTGKAAKLRQVFEQVKSLAGAGYQPYFEL